MSNREFKIIKKSDLMRIQYDATVACFYRISNSRAFAEQLLEPNRKFKITKPTVYKN
jgi:hypothetical protein